MAGSSTSAASSADAGKARSDTTCVAHACAASRCCTQSSNQAEREVGDGLPERLTMCMERGDLDETATRYRARAVARTNDFGDSYPKRDRRHIDMKAAV